MSDHWVQKMKTYFKRIDFDKDGAITRKDFEGMAERFIEHGKKSGRFDDDKSKDMETTLTAVWDKYLSDLGGGKKGIDQDAFIEGLKTHVNDPAMKTVFAGPLPLFFHAVDIDGDKQISPEEYKNFYRIIGVNIGFAAAAFKAIDVDGDGQLSCDEFTNAGAEFFTSEDPECPNAKFWGPLLDD